MVTQFIYSYEKKKIGAMYGMQVKTLFHGNPWRSQCETYLNQCNFRMKEMPNFHIHSSFFSLFQANTFTCLAYQKSFGKKNNLSNVM